MKRVLLLAGSLIVVLGLATVAAIWLKSAFEHSTQYVFQLREAPNRLTEELALSKAKEALSLDG
jgi:hypothetical protein